MAVVSRGIAVPCFREDPAELIELGVEAERAGFDGFFPWDHLVWCRRGQDHAVALCDPAGHSRPLACGRMADLWRARRQKRRPQRRAGVGRRSGDRPDDRWRSAAPGSPDGRGVPSASKSRIVMRRCCQQRKSGYAALRVTCLVMVVSGHTGGARAASAGVGVRPGTVVRTSSRPLCHRRRSAR